MQWKITCLIPRPILMPLSEKLVGLPSLVPRLPRNAKYTHMESPVSHDHDLIKIGPEFLGQKGNILRVIQQTLRSMLSVYDICSLIARYA